jgi:hypothetical protein
MYTLTKLGAPLDTVRSTTETNDSADDAFEVSIQRIRSDKKATVKL